MLEKTKLRTELLTRRLTLSEAEVRKKSSSMCAKFSTWVSKQSFVDIFLYCPFRNEPDLTALLTTVPQVRFAMPVVVSGTDMNYYEVSLQTNYRANKWGILEPQFNVNQMPMLPDRQSLIIMPALAVDDSGHRLGYGGGFYDRFLSKQKVTSMAAVFAEFKTVKIPTEKHDIQVDYILTESGVGEC